MRPAILLALLLLPWAGCVTPGQDQPLLPPLSRSQGDLFEYQPVVRGDPTPIPAVDCAALLADLNQRALDHSRVLLEQSVRNGGYGWYFSMRDTRTMAVAATAEVGSAGGAKADSSTAQVTGTNNQESAADEADLVKTDGEWTYVLQNGMLRILRSPKVGDLELFAQVQIADVWGGELLLERRDPADPADDRLVVIVQKAKQDLEKSGASSDVSGSRVAWGGYGWGGSATHVLVYSLADRSQPRLLRDLSVDGSPVGARLVDGVVHAVVHASEPYLLETGVGMDEDSLKRFGLTWEAYHQDTNATQREAMMETLAREADARNLAKLPTLTLADHIPAVTRDGKSLLPSGACPSILSVEGGKGRGTTTILSLDAKGNLADRAVQMAGASQVLYASADALVLTAPTQDSWWFWAQPALEEATDLHWFRLDGLQVTHLASGRVAGQVLDSFSLDVHDGRLRVATTTGQWARAWLEEAEPMMSHLAVFEPVAGQLAQTGIVGGLAPGERIWSARFTDDRAYIVTFRQTDPLWVIDVSGAVPKLLGELHIPGVSTYLHPLAGDMLLAVGIGPQGEEGLDWSRIQVSLFDVSDPTAPRRADVMDIAPETEGGYAWSTAVHEHKAFTYWDELGKLALPVNVEGRGTLRLIDVDLARRALYPAGSVDQRAVEQPGGWNSVERSWFLGFPEQGIVSVYTLGNAGATAHDLGTLRLQSAVAFPTDHYGVILD